MDFLFLFRGVALPWKANSDEVKHITAFSDIVFKVWTKFELAED